MNSLAPESYQNWVKQMIVEREEVLKSKNKLDIEMVPELAELFSNSKMVAGKV